MKVEHDEFGRELVDETPMEVPLALRAPMSIEERIQRAIRIQASIEAAQRGLESFDEADDFSVDDDEFQSEHEMSELQEEEPRPSARRKEVKRESRVEVDHSSVGDPAAPEVVPPAPGAVRKPAKSGKDQAGDQGDD